MSESPGSVQRNTVTLSRTVSGFRTAGVHFQSPTGSPRGPEPFMPTRQRSIKKAGSTASLSLDAAGSGAYQDAPQDPSVEQLYTQAIIPAPVGRAAPSRLTRARSKLASSAMPEDAAVLQESTNSNRQEVHPQSRPASPTKIASAFRSDVVTPRVRATQIKARPLSMYDVPSPSSCPLVPRAALTAEDAVAKKRKQLAAAKRLKDAREGQLVASVESRSHTLLASDRHERQTSPTRQDRGFNATPTQSPLKRAQSVQFRTHQAQEADHLQPSVLDMLSISGMDDEGLNSETSFVYQGNDSAEGADPELNTQDPINTTDSVQVHVRIRPPRGDDDVVWVASEGGSSVALSPALAQSRVTTTTTSFNFDGVHTRSANKSIYLDVARPLIRSVLDGYDAVVFAYGQTGSGKTWTLSGDDEGQEPGIIPRAIADIFAGIRQASTNREFLIRVSYMEVYNEQLKDLLMPSNLPQIRDETRGGRRGTVVKPLQEEIVTTPAQVNALLALGTTNRHIGATDWNDRSSRSHTAFKLTLESWERSSDEPWSTELDPERAPGSPAKQRVKGRTVRVSELSMIDLAGSERYVSKGGATARSEGSAINKSLLCLGRVIAALSAPKEGQFVPFRDSKLTRILQNSLSGNAKVAVVCTLNPSSSAIDESLSTLSFAKRVKKVALSAQRNEIDSSDGLGSEGQALLQRYRAEAEQLRRQVQQLQAQSSDVVSVVDDERIQELRQRLEQIGGLIMVGGGEEEDEEDSIQADDNSANARPMSPTKRGFRFDEAAPVLQEKLFKANCQIEELQKRLAKRPSLPPACMTEEEKDVTIRRLKQRVQELELVCEAQAVQGPLPQTKEDIDVGLRKKVEELQAQISRRDRYLMDLSRECHSLRNTNRQLMRLAHLDASNTLASLGTPNMGAFSPKTPTPGSPAASRTPVMQRNVRHVAPRRSTSLSVLRTEHLFHP